MPSVASRTLRQSGQFICYETGQFYLLLTVSVLIYGGCQRLTKSGPELRRGSEKSAG